MKEKNIILTARIMSMIFTPFYLPMVGLIALFIFSYMSLLPIGYKLVMLGMVYLLTVVAHRYSSTSTAWFKAGPRVSWARRSVVLCLTSSLSYVTSAVFSGWNTAIRLASSVSS